MLHTLERSTGRKLGQLDVNRGMQFIVDLPVSVPDGIYIILNTFDELGDGWLSV